MDKKLIVILGPTASGKSALAVELARRFNGEVVSADSRQVYRGLDIGSGKITKREMRGIRHHLLDVVSPRRRFTAADYQKKARKAVRDILKRGKLPIICGGTGLYIDALLYDTSFPAVKPDPVLRKKLEKLSAAQLFAQLQQRDPRRAASIDRHNKRRLVRALEIVRSTGKPVPMATNNTFLYDTLKLGIRLSAQDLASRIHTRLMARLKGGLVAEVRKLHTDGLSWKRLEEFGLEYRYISRYLKGEMDKKEMLQQLEREIVRYAKRQMTWFKRDTDIVWVKSNQNAVSKTRRFL